jgi:hypothetical protein
MAAVDAYRGRQTRFERLLDAARPLSDAELLTLLEKYRGSLKAVAILTVLGDRSTASDVTQLVSCDIL